MKLLKVYIENFGKISKTEYDFNGTLTAFCYENGYGKTTLATFIKSMFYGLPKVTKTTKFNDREHYYPFEGGKFGGNLTFEKDNKIYKIVRFFDKTSETKDEITLYENDNLVSAIPENIGKWVFGVDEASFSRTLYFTEASSISESRSDITFKLTGVVDARDDESFIEAKKILENAKKNLKKTGNKGEISEVKQEIFSVNEEILNLKSIDSALGEKYQERSNLLIELEKAEEELKKVSDLKIKQDNFNTYKSYIEEASKIEEDINKIKKDYPFGLVSDSDLTALKNSATNLYDLNREKARIVVDGEKQNEYEYLSNTFKNGVPTVSDLENLKNDINSLSKVEENTKKIKNMPLFLIGVLEIIVGIVLLFLNPILGVIFLGVAVSFISVSFLVKTNNKVDNSEAILKIEYYLKLYGINNPNYWAGVYELENKIEKYNYLSKEINEKLGYKKAIDRSFNESLEVIKAIFNKYNLVIYNIDNLNEQIKGIESDIIVINNKKETLNNLIKKAENYKREKGLDKKIEGVFDYDEVNFKCKELRDKLAFIDRQIKNSEDLLEALPSKEIYLKELEEKKEKLIKRYESVSLTLDYLLKAEESLKNKYVNPVKEVFISYATKLEKILGEKVIMDKNFEVYYERSGENKSREYLSAGQSILCDLCLRLALVDNMYKDENPFIILDDPFITLDENHIKMALDLIKELSKNRQIIYFTCHESRNI